MQKIKNYLTEAGVINFLIGILTLNNTFVYSIVLFITGIFFLNLSQQDEEKIKKSKTTLFTLSIIFIFLNIFTSICLFLCSDKISEYEKTNKSPNPPPTKIKKIIDPEAKKIDILLKLGVFMVFISAILFTTTSWSFLKDFHKISGLLFFGCLFLSLSFLTEKKFKLYRSSYVYWILSMLFFSLMIVGNIYLGINGLSYTSNLKNFAIFLTFFTVAGLSIATYLKFSKDYLLYITYASILLSISHLLLFLIQEPIMVIIIISSLLFAINVIASKKSILFYFSKIVSYLMIVFIIQNIADEILTLIAVLINIANLAYLPIKQKFMEDSLISLILIYALIIYKGVTINTENTSFVCLGIFLIISLYTFFMRLKYPQEKKYNDINYIIYSILTILLSLSTYEFPYGAIALFESNTIINLLISVIYFTGNTILSLKSKRKELVTYFSPLSIFLVSTSIFYKETFSVIFSLTTIIYCLYHYCYKDSNLKKIYLYAAMIGVGIGFLLNKTTFSAILTLLSSSYLFYKSLLIEENHQAKENLILSCILFIASIYNILVPINILNMGKIIPSIIMIWILIIITQLSNKEIIKNISLFAIVVPIYNIMIELTSNMIYHHIMISILILYITFLIIKFICKKEEDKNITGLMGIIFAVLEVAFISNYTIGIYIGTIGIMTILVGYYKKKQTYFFNTGIIITITNIIYQLKIWNQIPFWLYLLLGGLSIIGFVTYKEMKKNKKMKNDK